MKQISDETDLVLARSISNFYVIEDVTRNLPQVTENIGQLRAIGTNIAAMKVMTEEQRTKLNALLPAVSPALHSIEYSSEVIKTNDPQLYDSVLKQPYQLLNTEASKLVMLYKRTLSRAGNHDYRKRLCLL
ncbi:hypothetical protein ACP26L_07890 [Paenibacillus sp. S-38]|uniref:hypothetical protein n=1 Tax=Paenibacillus sp. S-38 TaxID=3416710 RepID=UPI003CF975DA